MSTETTQDLAAKSGLAVTDMPRPGIIPKGKKPPRFSTYVTTEVDVDIDPDDLHDEGWHHETECEAMAAAGLAEQKAADAGELADIYRVAIVALHHEAHGRSPIILCRSEPCISLSLDQLRGAA